MTTPVNLTVPLGKGLSKKRDERTLDMFAHQAAG